MSGTGSLSLPEFPSCGANRLGQPALLLERGFQLRAARNDDLPFLRALYARTRDEELAFVPWPEAMRSAFIDQQFALQHRHYVAHYHDADFLLIEHGSSPIGRFYVHPGPNDLLVIDISLLPEFRCMGIGSSLLAHTQSFAKAHSLGVQLHVLHANLAARRLYRRMGFIEVADEGSHLRMQWPTSPSAQLNRA
jgi:ribosomal protein S18 acetylase RimI-like enzyme